MGPTAPWALVHREMAADKQGRAAWAYIDNIAHQLGSLSPAKTASWAPLQCPNMAAATKLGRLMPTQTAVFVCDIQERFKPIITGMPAVVDTARRLVRGHAPPNTWPRWTPNYAALSDG